MANRTTQTVVHFRHAFSLPGSTVPFAAGNYRVDHDEESIDGLSHLAWNRIGSFIHLPAIGAQSARHQMVPVNPSDLNAAAAKDGRQARSLPSG